MTVFEDYAPFLSNPILATTNEFYCGTEYEIEDIKEVKLPGFPHGCPLNDGCPLWLGDIGVMKDGSLRNGGMEFVTAPVPFARAIELFSYLHSNLILGKEPYSKRTSTHVHVNVASMTQKQVKEFVLLYALLEPCFFSFTTGREHNIHCVPLNYTLLPQYYNRDLPSLVDRWSKYTAFNLSPVASIGTVEFRHLEGTGNFQVYQQWLTMIHDLWDYVKQNNLSLYDMLQSGMAPTQIQMKVLPSTRNFGLVDADFYSSLIDVKLAFV